MTKRKTKTTANHIEAAIASLLKANDKKLFDHASWLADMLPARKMVKAYKAIQAAKLQHGKAVTAKRWAVEQRALH